MERETGFEPATLALATDKSNMVAKGDQARLAVTAVDNTDG